MYKNTARFILFLLTLSAVPSFGQSPSDEKSATTDSAPVSSEVNKEDRTDNKNKHRRKTPRRSANWIDGQVLRTQSSH